jgi:hypothetical protein
MKNTYEKELQNTSFRDYEITVDSTLEECTFHPGSGRIFIKNNSQYQRNAHSFKLPPTF